MFSLPVSRRTPHYPNDQTRFGLCKKFAVGPIRTSNVAAAPSLWRSSDEVNISPLLARPSGSLNARLHVVPPERSESSADEEIVGVVETY